MTEETKVEAEAKAPVDPNAGLDEFGVMLKDKLRSQITERNAIAEQVKAANGDPADLLTSLRESYKDDEQVAKITAAIEEIDNKREALFKKRDEILAPVVEKMVEEAKAGLGDLPEKLAKMDKVVSKARAYLVETYSTDVLGDLPALVGKRTSSGTSGGGTGNRRIRGFDFYIDDVLATSKNAKNEDVSNAAAAAKKLGITTEDIRNQFWSAAGTDDSKKYPPVVEFVVTTEVEGKSTNFKVTAKRVDDSDEAAA